MNLNELLKKLQGLNRHLFVSNRLSDVHNERTHNHPIWDQVEGDGRKMFYLKDEERSEKICFKKIYKMTRLSRGEITSCGDITCMKL